MKTFIITLITLLAMPFGSTLANAQSMSIKNAWIAEAPPVSKVMVAYMIIENNSNEELTIVKAESDLYSSIEFHETKYENGIAKMIRHKELIIPAHAQISLERGGKHLMLFNPVKRLKAGETAGIKLTTKSHINKNIIVTVKKSKY